MNLPSKEELNVYLKTVRKEFPRDSVAKHLGLAESTLTKSLAPKGVISNSMRYEIAKFVGMIKEEPAPTQVTDSVVVLPAPHQDHLNWQRVALSENQTVSEWLLDAGNEKAAQILKEGFGIDMEDERRKNAGGDHSTGSKAS